MLHWIITILVGLATLACTQHFDNNKPIEQHIPNKDDDVAKVKLLKRSAECGNSEWQQQDTQKSSDGADKRAWNSMQPSWGKRKWQDMQNPGWGKRSADYDREIQAGLQTSFDEDKRGWRDMQGASWGKRGWQDMRQPSWGKRGWKDMQTSAWGKRGWQDMQGNWGKRGWQDMQSLNWGKRRWQDMQGPSWGKRGWKELQSSGWGKRSDDQELDKRGWQDMKISGYGKRAWNELQSSGWGKRAWKDMQGLNWGKRSSHPIDQHGFDTLEEDWELPMRNPDDLSLGDTMEPMVAVEWPVRRLTGANRNDWRLFEPVSEQTMVDKLLEGLQKSSMAANSHNPKKILEGEEDEEAGTKGERNP
ncbi:Hypothetical protein NTJ_04344 [Nesidiocoris tenuis]|uniref:Uncharacterized protein n=1 Tax=Nesidiocoris tenuis TaxID=355587 RepID=A0ABN7AGZ0_9HEMI|nr:Hypothetical protein NTJ_04344 [Nesidiocoris tenuis]